jgi:hypothetical protein
MLPAEVTDESCERINAADGPGCSLSPKFVNQGITADIVVTRSGRRVCSKKSQPRKGEFKTGRGVQSAFTLA